MRSIDTDWCTTITEEESEVIIQQSEFVKCTKNFSHFCEYYVKIVHWKYGLIPYKLWPIHEKLIEHFEDNRFAAVVKPRQTGLSTLMAIWFLWKCMFRTDQRCMFLTKTDREACYAGMVIDKALQELPDWLKPNLSKHNDHTKTFSDTSSTVYFYAPEASCGKAVSHLYVDESAFISNMESHWKAMWPMLSTGGHCVTASTVNGKHGWFYDIIHKENKFAKMTVNYKDNPGNLAPDWEDEMLNNLGEYGWRQEYLCEFLDPPQVARR